MNSAPLIKEKNRFEDRSLGHRWKRLASYVGLARANLAFLGRLGLGRVEWPALFEPHELDAGFFGVNCPPSPTPELEDLMFDSLREIGLRSVRVDWGYESDSQSAGRWLERLSAAGFDVLLHLVQPSAEAARMSEEGARRRWAQFLEPIFDRFGARIRRYEIGSTPNRRRWSGYTVADYVAACRTAHELASARGLEILGPNTSDFAPYFTVGILQACRRAGVRFAALTDNLFVDRAGAPETYDPSVAGRALRNVARLDLTRKSAALAAIAKAFGIDRTYSTYAYYTLSASGRRRKSRKRPWRYVSEETYADFLVRHFVASAAAGALDRVYWGNLAGHYKGILDDGYRHRPDPPSVHHKYHNYGEPSDYKRRPAFASFRHLVGRLQGARFVAALSRRDPFVFLFERQGAMTAVAWSAKAEGEPSPQVDELLGQGAKVFSRDGQRLEIKPPARLSGSPIYVLPGKAC